jgi:tetratricopeptide (TPR) repeat protein
MKPTTPLWCAAVLVAACASITPPTSAESQQLESIRKLMASDLDAAANAAEDLLQEKPTLREARLLLAECSLQMANEPGRSGKQFLLMDAARNFDEALDSAEDEPFAREWRLCAEAHYALGEFDKGSVAANRSANGFAKKPGLDNKKEFATSRLVGARCNYRIFVEERQAEIESGDKDQNGLVRPSKRIMTLAQVVAAGFQNAQHDYPAEAATTVADVHKWLGQTSEVQRTYEAAVSDWPAETGIHDAYIDWMTQNGQHDALVGAYRRFVRAQPDAPVLRWFEGRAIYRRADQLRTQGNFQGAIAIYQKSRDVFGEYIAVMPNHRTSSAQWQALCDLSIARCAADSGDLEKATEVMFRAAETAPATTTYVDGNPQLVDAFGNHFTGVAFAIHVALTQAPENALQRTLAFNEQVVQKYPDRWGFLYNNAALAARDLGVQVQNDGDDKAAMELWERSYRYYEKAVALSPTDARIVNDCGLMLIYHLDRDFDRARECFDKAIEIGTAQLAELSDDTPARERELLEEAVGDAWQNIAVLMREHEKKPFADYKQFCEQAVKYYPYQRREAASLLRNEGKSNLGSTARAQLQNRLSGSSKGQGGAAEALKKAQPKVDEAIGNEDFDAALNVLDKLSKDCKEYAPYHFLKGKVTWMLANQARDNNRKGTEFFYQDAVVALTRAVELDAEPNEPRQMLAQALYDAGNTEKATEAISSLLLHMQSQGGGSEAENLAAHTVRANAAGRAYAQKKSGGSDDPTLLTAARTSMRWLEQKGKLDEKLLALWSATEAWAGAPAEAVNVYIRAAERAPDDFNLLEQVINTAANQKQLPLAVEALGKRDDAGTIWYRGKAQFWLAGAERQSGKADEALQTLDASRKSFELSMQKNAGYADSCKQWIAMVVGKKGCITLNVKDDRDAAQKLLLEAAQMRPDMINQDLGLTETIKGGILRLVDFFYRKNDLKRVEQISRAASDAANSDVDLLNNSGLFARDYGNILERQGNSEAAQEMYEQSYKAYTRAQQLDPSNVRLRNDCALIAIYHLERDWDLVKKLLDGAIEDGNNTLENSPPDNEELKQQLEEAVGDCYENLALWHLKHSKDAEAAKAAAKKSQDYYPGARRPGAARHLRAAERLLQGK